MAGPRPLGPRARSSDYHASGAWGAIGAAAAAARLLRLGRGETRHALGLAEYHAPIAPTMRAVADPAMSKDACGWGAYVGTSAALLARHGFTAVGGAFLDAPPATTASTLGRRWHVEETYVKAFPCCRWSQPAIAAALALRREHALEPGRIDRVRVQIFAAATALARRLPSTTEQAQYSLIWPFAAALVHGDFAVQHILPPAFSDVAVVTLAEQIESEIDDSFEASFPATRLARVVIDTTDGVSHRSEPSVAPGEPDDPTLATIVATKFDRYVTDRVPLLDSLLQPPPAWDPVQRGELGS